jgi:hypothetical protein
MPRAVVKAVVVGVSEERPQNRRDADSNECDAQEKVFGRHPEP